MAAGTTNSSEHAEQCAFFEWIRLSEAKYPELKVAFAVPNGAKLPYSINPRSGQRFSRQAIYLLKEGLRPGVPDLCLPIPKGIYHGAFIEMKFGRNQLTPQQRDFLAQLNNLGYLIAVCRSADEAIGLTQAYLDLRPGAELEVQQVLDRVRKCGIFGDYSHIK